MPRWIRPVVFGALALVLGACGGGRRIDFGCGELAASDDRSAIAYIHGDELIVIAGDAQHRLASTAACPMAGADSLLVSPGGRTVALYGTQSNISGDLWGHAGRNISAACTIDVASAAVTAMPADVGDDNGEVNLRAAPGERVLMWRTDDRPVPLLVMDRAHAVTLELPGARCRIGAIGTDRAIAVCLDGGALIVRRYRLGGTPAIDGPDTRLPAHDVGTIDGTALSGDARYFSYWGRTEDGVGPIRNRAYVVDLQRGGDVFTYDQTFRGAIVSIELDPRGADADVLVAEWTEGDDQQMEGRVRRFTRAGRVVHEHHLRAAPDAAYWTEPDRYWAVTSCEAEQVRM
jgi:hypothetical protein